MLRIVLIILIGSALQHCFAQGKKGALLTVGQNATTASDFEYLFKKNNKDPKTGLTEAGINEYLQLIVNFKLKIAEAMKNGLDTTANFRKEFANYREELRRPYSANKNIMDKLTQEAYDRLKWEVNAAHILIRVTPDASPKDTLTAYNAIASVRDKLSKGGDFLALAREFSEDPSAKTNSGNLGYFSALQMVYPFEKAVYGLKAGEVSPIFRTQFGYHLTKMIDKRPARGELEAAHILIKKGEFPAKAKTEIFDIYNKLNSGVAWDTLCRTRSQDVSTKDNGGKLRPFGVGALSSVPEFEAAAFGLQHPGDISNPVESRSAWHIIKLIKKIPLADYSEIETSLKQRVSRDERLRTMETKALEEKKKKLGFEENASLKKNFFDLADSTLANAQWKYKGEKNLLSMTLFAIQGRRPVTGEDFVKFVIERQGKEFQAPRIYMTQLYNQLVNEKIGEIEEEELMKNNADFRNLFTEYKEGILLFDIMEKEVWHKASADSVGQLHYYDQHKDKYTAGERVEARVFTLKSAQLLEEVKEKITKGDTLKPADMEKFSSVSDVRMYEKGASKAVDKAPRIAGVYFLEVEGAAYVVEVLRLAPPGIKSFQEARPAVVADYQNELEKNWLAQLRKKYPVEINRAELKAVKKKILSKKLS